MALDESLGVGGRTFLGVGCGVGDRGQQGHNHCDLLKMMIGVRRVSTDLLDPA